MTQVGVRDATGRFTETFEIFAQLSGPGSLTPVTVRHAMTVAGLKSLIELVCGIPTDLQLLTYQHHAVLTDGDTLGNLCLLPGSRLPVKIAYGYDGLVDATLRGDLKEVLMRIAVTKESTGMARRRFVAMFVAAQRGYHYLVDRMLCEGADPDSRTPASGRTALHVACAMGNSGCLDSLLQHGASLNLKDASGQTPADIAVSCGQQGAQRRLILYSRILANKVSRQRPCAWPTSPRFPKSKLGSSVTPTLALQDLAISPGPQLMITNWKGREHHHNFFEKRPRSAKSSLFQSDSSTSSTESWSSLKDRGVHKDQPHLTKNDSSEDSSVSKPVLREEVPIYRSVPLHHRPKSARSLKSVKFDIEESPAPPSTMAKYSSYSSSGATKPHPHRVSTQSFPSSLSGTTVSHGHFDDCHGNRGQCETTPGKHRHQERSGQEDDKAENRVDVSRNPQAVDGPDGCPVNQTGSDGMSSGNSYNSVKELDLKEVNDVRMNHLNDKLRAMIGLPIQHPQRLESMKEGQERPTSGSSPAKRTRKPTPEENEQAFKEWLASKTQDARDQRLVNRVGKMLEDAFGKKDETLIVDDDEDQGQKRKPLQFEAWSEKKAKQERVQSARLTTRTTKQEQRKKEQLEARLSMSGTTVENWLAEKIKKQKQERLVEKQQESERQQLKTEREKAAQDVFEKWCMQKQWEELQMLKGRPNSGCKKRRPKSSNSTKARVSGTSISSRRIRSHSAPPRRQTVHPV